jgi:hypothetical protein
VRRILPLVAVLALAGCSAAPQHATAFTCGTTGPGVLTVSTAYRGGAADPAPRRIPVKIGSTVQLTVASDAVAQIHVHGYDVEYDVDPSGTGCTQFVADRVGLFDVEAHPDTLLLQLEVR